MQKRKNINEESANRSKIQKISTIDQQINDNVSI